MYYLVYEKCFYEKEEYIIIELFTEALSEEEVMANFSREASQGSNYKVVQVNFNNGILELPEGLGCIEEGYNGSFVVDDRLKNLLKKIVLNSSSLIADNGGDFSTKYFPALEAFELKGCYGSIKDTYVYVKDGIIYVKFPSDSYYTMYHYPPAKKDKIYIVPKNCGLLCYRFQNLAYLETVVIPDNTPCCVGEEGYFWFSGCKNLKNIVFLNKIDNLYYDGKEVVTLKDRYPLDPIAYDCPNLKNIYVYDKELYYKLLDIHRKLEADFGDRVGYHKNIVYIGDKNIPKLFKELGIPNNSEVTGIPYFDLMPNDRKDKALSSFKKKYGNPSDFISKVFTIDKSTGASKYTVGEVRDLLISCGYTKEEANDALINYLKDEHLTN